MRDPDLVSRAQRAATALERAWDHWRTSHGLDAEPLPPVSSYVGYSLEEPWGQPRVVFGIAAEEAEQLATFLDLHRPAGPGQAGNGRLAQAGNGRLAPAGSGQPSPAGNGAGSGRPSPAGNGLPSPAGNGKLSPAAHGLSAQDSVPGALTGDAPGPGLLTGAGAAPGRSASEEPAPGPSATETAAAYGKSLWRPRSHRHAGEHAAQRPARQHGPAGAAGDNALPPAEPTPPRDRSSQGQDDDDEGAERDGLVPMAGDMAGWASGELPGQASRGPEPWTFAAHSDLNHAEPSNGESRGGRAH